MMSSRLPASGLAASRRSSKAISQRLPGSISHSVSATSRLLSTTMAALQDEDASSEHRPWTPDVQPSIRFGGVNGQRSGPPDMTMSRRLAPLKFHVAADETTRAKNQAKEAEQLTIEELLPLPLVIPVRRLHQVWHPSDSSRAPGHAPPAGNSKQQRYVVTRFAFDSYANLIEFTIKLGRLVRTAASKPRLGLTVDAVKRHAIVSLPVLSGIQKDKANSNMTAGKAMVRLRTLHQDLAVPSNKDNAEMIKERDELVDMVRDRYLSIAFEPVAARMERQLREAYQHIALMHMPTGPPKEMLDEELTEELFIRRELPKQKKMGDDKLSKTAEFARLKIERVERRERKARQKREAAGGPGVTATVFAGSASGSAGRDDITDRVPVSVPGEAEIQEKVEGGSAPRGGEGSAASLSTSTGDGEDLQERVPFPVPESASDMGSPPTVPESERTTPRTANREADEQQQPVDDIQDRVPFPSASSSEDVGSPAASDGSSKLRSVNLDAVEQKEPVDDMEERVPFPVPSSADEMGSPATVPESERDTPRSANVDAEEQKVPVEDLGERVPFPSATGGEEGKKGEAA